MDKLIEYAGHGAAYVGTIACAVSGAARLAGFYDLAGYSVQSTFVLGMGLMVFACLAKLHQLTISS